MAQKLGINGEVWNTEDGSVEMVAGHADESVLNEFANRLHDGPGRVGVILATESEAPLERGFFIGLTR